MPRNAPELHVYLNGRHMPRSEARLPIEDRGTLFGDGVYEVLEYYAGRPFAMQAHVDRLRRSLDGIRLSPPAELDHLPALNDDLVRLNGLSDARLYWQVTRGPAPRHHLPPQHPEPSVLLMADPIPPLDLTGPTPSCPAITHEDERWSGCWIKSLMLLPNTLAKDRAREAGAQEAILHREGRVTEGGSTNVIAVREGRLWTHPADRWILGGITRAIVLDLAREAGLAVHEQALTLDELASAEEIMLTGTTTHVTAVTQLDGRTVGDGEPGPVARRLHEAFMQRVATECGLAAG